MGNEDIDAAVRREAFNFLSRLSKQYGEVLPRQELGNGFCFEGTRVPLCGPQGIFKPKLLDLPLSITTAPNQPYNDFLSDDDILQYRYRGTDPSHRDNTGLRRAMNEKKPLIYLHGVVPGKYIAQWPVYVIGDNLQALTFTVDLSPAALAHESVMETTRGYGNTIARMRLHQRVFRERVLNAYQKQCALCRLRHASLLDAAHIIPDSAGGEPRVANGLALCKLHHAAFDQNILGIRPDYSIEICLDILEETDGPMLKHGLQEMHDRKIWVPRSAGDRPDPNALEQRYEEFRAAH